MGYLTISAGFFMTLTVAYTQAQYLPNTNIKEDIAVFIYNKKSYIGNGALVTDKFIICAYSFVKNLTEPYNDVDVMIGSKFSAPWGQSRKVTSILKYKNNKLNALSGSIGFIELTFATSNERCFYTMGLSLDKNDELLKKTVTIIGYGQLTDQSPTEEIFFVVREAKFSFAVKPEVTIVPESSFLGSPVIYNSYLQGIVTELRNEELFCMKLTYASPFLKRL